MRLARRHVATGTLLGLVLLLGVVVSPNSVREQLQSMLWEPWFPLALVGLYVLRPVLAWPISALSILVGFRYGLAVGFPVAMAGVVFTSLLPYGLARVYQPDSGLLGTAATGSRQFFGTTGHLRGVIAARLAPTPAEVISVAAGVGRVSLPAFVIGTVIGEIPWTAAAVFAGYSMRSLTLSANFDIRLAVAGAIAGGLLVAGPVYRHVRDGDSRIAGL